MSRRILCFRAACLFLAAACLAGPASALPPTPTQVTLRAATSPADLRARLMTFAKGAEATDKVNAGEAWFFVGESFRRGANPDSAILAYRRSLELRGTYEDRYAVASALMARQAPGDVDEGLKVATAAAAEALNESARAASRFQALAAWGKLLAGDADGSRALFEGIEPDLTGDFEWRFRYARALMTGAETTKAIQLLRPLAVASRAQAPDVMELLEVLARQIGQGPGLDQDLADRMGQRDKIEDRVVDRVQGRRIKFAASDGFPLSGVLLETSGSGRHRPAIVMMAPEDTLADFDSLGVALRSFGLHTLMLAARGSGWSVGPTCPLPYTWRGREEAMLRRSARDLRDAVRAVCLATKTDTSGIVLVASRSMAMAAATAAAQDRRIRALVLLSPDPDLVDRGTVVAALAKRRIPIFIQQTMEDYLNADFVDDAYHAGVESASRVSDGHSGGHGAIAFRMDPGSPRASFSG